MKFRIMILTICAAMLITSSTSLVSAEEDDLTDFSYENSYVEDEFGNRYPLNVSALNSDFALTSEEYEQSYCYEFDFSNIDSANICSSETSTDYDNSGRVRAVLTITYSRSGNDYLLTKVNGNITVFDSDTSVISKSLIYGCSSVNTTQVNTVYPGMTFSYNTGFSNYVAADGMSVLGATLYITLQNSGQWTFVLDNKLLNTSASISGRWN